MSTSPLPGRGETSGPVGTLRESVLTGLAIVIPALITVYVLELVLGFLLRGAAPWMRVLISIWPGIETSPVLVDAAVLLSLALGTVVLGYVVHFHAGDAVVRTVDGAIMRLPGVGTLYRSVTRVVDSMLMGDGQGFKDVKLVEVPAADHHMLGFLISESPTAVEGSFDGDVATLFVPMAPNPVMAGFVIHVEESRLTEVDMTVEEAMSAIVSLGATEEHPSEAVNHSYRADYDLSG